MLAHAIGKSCGAVLRVFSNEKLLSHLTKWRLSFATVPTKASVGLRNNAPLQNGSKKNIFCQISFFLNIHSILILHKAGKKQKREERAAAHTACLIFSINKQEGSREVN